MDEILFEFKNKYSYNALVIKPTQKNIIIPFIINSLLILTVIILSKNDIISDLIFYLIEFFSMVLTLFFVNILMKKVLAKKYSITYKCFSWFKNNDLLVSINNIQKQWVRNLSTSIDLSKLNEKLEKRKKSIRIGFPTMPVFFLTIIAAATNHLFSKIFNIDGINLDALLGLYVQILVIILNLYAIYLIIKTISSTISDFVINREYGYIVEIINLIDDFEIEKVNIKGRITKP